jgi:CTD small phosphatase-like protein 2
LEDVQTQSRTVTPLSSSQSIELVVPSSKTEEEEDAYDSSVSTTRQTDRSSSSVGIKLSEDSRDAVDRLETVHELNESKEVNSELEEDESGNGEVKPLAQSQAELSIEEDIMVEIVEETEETRDEEEEGSDEVSEEEFDSYLFMANVPPLASLKPPPVAPPSLPLKPRHAPKVTLVLDLDETLVHCSLEKIDNPDLIFAVPYEGEEFQVYVRKRPGFEQFLSRVSELFEVAVFTASQKAYADKLLNILDPTHKWIHHRLFRESCVQVLGNYLKDLNVLGRELSKVVIVDNSPHVFAYQVDNGVPIESWYNDSRDRELLHLLPFLETLAKCSDVRPMIRNKFHTHKKVEESLRAYNEVVQAAHEPSERRSRMKSHLRRRRQSQNDEDKEDTENHAEEVAQEELIEGDGLEPGTPLVSEDGVDVLKAEEVETGEDDEEDSTASRRSSRRTSTTTTKRVRSVYTMNASTKKSASSAASSSSHAEAQTAQKTRSSASSRRQSVVEGDSSDENGESEKTERTSPAPAPRRKARIRSRLPLADESDSDAELAKMASPPAKKVAKRR